jgi:hypothetical protein
MHAWRFDPVLGEERVRGLLVAPPFKSIVVEIEREMEVLCYHADPCRDNGDFSRVVYCVRLSRPLFDLFFNSENGYRGSYFSSPYAGLEANGTLMESLTPRLMEWTRANHGAEAVRFADESIRTPSAKAWLTEPIPQSCDKCVGEWSSDGNEASEILNARWERESDRRAIWGRKAPYLTKIKIFGAFLNDRNDELVPARKRHRAQEIQRFGWS